MGAILTQLEFLLLCLPVLLGPWLFGAAEPWWFWPFAVCIFGSSALFGVRLLTGASPRPAAVDAGPRGILFWCLPFLVYAFVRFLQADVFMDAERSFLLFLTPLLLGLQVLYGLPAAQRRRLHRLILVNLALIGLYGIANHVTAGNAMVLWAPGFEKYQVGYARATGPFFCPDHFSGAMELGLAVALGVLVSRERRRGWRLAAGGLAVIALAGILLSKSRGGGLTAVVLLVAVLVWGFAQWPRETRLWWRVCAGLGLILVGAGLWAASPGYAQRFKDYFTDRAAGNSLRERVAGAAARAGRGSRATMISGALRAWRTRPVFGIGPGMHQNLWPDFAATPDGDRAAGVWPSRINAHFHSYEVHSDWVQLLEEYGAAGLLLFLAPAGLVFTRLRRGVRRAREDWVRVTRRGGRAPDYAVVLGALLALAAMGFHSLGDFNLQVPGITWLLGALLGLGLAEYPGPAGSRGV
ncbi:MAG: O-antigen ligase family protein [Lentisphaerae bacterium]|nr:O-antigen ligase family protein [Lentisphaerota bacterium]